MHGVHRIGRHSIAFLDAVNGFTLFGEDVRVLGRREDTVEVGLVEAFADLEDGERGGGRGEGDLVRCCSNNRTIAFVEIDLMLFILACPYGPDYDRVSCDPSLKKLASHDPIALYMRLGMALDIVVKGMSISYRAVRRRIAQTKSERGGI